MCVRQHLTLKHFIAVAESLSSILEILLVFFHTSLPLGILTFSLRLNKVFCRDIFVYFQMAAQGSYIQVKQYF